MTGFMGFVRAFSVLIAALLLSLGVALPAGAASSNTQQVTRVASVSPSRADALAARRAAVSRDLDGAGRSAAVKSAADEEAKARRMPASQERAVEARARALAVQEEGSGPSFGMRRPSLFEAPAEASSSEASSDVEGVPDGFAVTDPVQSLTGGILAGSGTASVTPGEQLTVAVYVFVSGESSGEVDVTFSDYCGGSDTTTIGSQTVTAPEFGSTPDGALVTQDVTVPSDCPYGYVDDGLYAYNLSWSVTPVGGGETGSGFASFSWLDIPEAQLTECDCSTDSADAGSARADAGDPVDTVSGAYAMSVTDASLQSPGYPLAISRSYSSANTSSGSLGPGWSVPWDANLSIDSSTGNITFTAENGDQYLYYADGDGYDSGSGSRSVLEQVTDSSGDVTGYTLTDLSDHDVLTFNASGQLQSEDDSTGRGLTFAYNSSEQVSSITDAAGQSVTLAYNSSGLLTGVTLPDQDDLTISYGYTDGLLTSVATPGGTDGEWTYYTYNSAGLLATVQDADGNVTVQNTYNSSGQVTEQEDGDGDDTLFSYTTTSSGVSETDVTAPDGGITTYLYVGDMLEEDIGPVDDAATYYVYNEFLEPVAITDPLSRTTNFGYDAEGDLTSETDDLGNSQYWTYDGNSNVLSYENADSQTTNYTYNSMDEVLTETSPKSEETQYTYNSNGSLASEISARNYTTRYAYFSDGMLESVQNPDGDTTSYTYDSMGYPLTVTDPMNRETTYTYNPAEEVAAVTTPAGETQYGYDDDGNLTSREDPDLNTWTYKYDADNLLTKATDPLGDSDSYGYNGDGDQNSFTDGRGIVTTTTYNEADEPTGITYSDGTPSVSYLYDADGEVTSVTDGTGTRTLSYNGDGEVTGEGGFSYTYDDAGNIASREYPDGTTTGYEYNGDGEVSSMTVGSATTTYSYDADGDLTATAEPDGVTESEGYDNADQLTSVSDATSSKTLDSYGLTLNADGQPTVVAVTQDGTADPTRYYGYNTDGEMTSECYSSSGMSACSAASEGTATGSAADTPASGMVTSGESGMCLDDSTGSTTAGNKIVIDTCTAGSGQQWTASDNGTVEVQGNCMAAAGTSSGSVVELEPCTAHDAAEQWRAGSSWELVNTASGLCLTDPSGSTTSGTQLDVTACSAATDQEWRMPDVSGGWLTDGVTGECADDSGGSSTAGADVVIDDCDGSVSQQKWGFETDGEVEINSLCAEPAGAGTTQSTVIVLETCVSGSTAQEWAVGPDWWVLNINADMCLSDPDASTTAGTQLVITPCTGNTQQSWRVPAYNNAGDLANEVAGECADADGSEAVIYDCSTSSTAQDLKVTGGANLVTSTGDCLEPSGGGTTTGTKVVVTTCSGAEATWWAEGPSTDAWITSVISGLCLADTDASTTNGTQLNVATCSGSTQQHWILPVTTTPWTPADVTVTAGAGSATVSREPESGGGNAITGYTVTSSGGQTATAGADATSATVTGLTTGTSYTFTVTADTADPVATASSAATTAITPGNETSYTYDAAGNTASSETDGITTTNSYNADEELTSSVTGSVTTDYGYDDDGNQTSVGGNSYTYNAADEMTGADTTAGNFAYSYDGQGDLAATSLDGTELSDTIWDLNNPIPEAAEDTTSSGTVTDEYDWNPDGTLNSETEGGATGTGTTYGAVTDPEGSLTGLVNSAGTQVSTTTYSAYGTASTTGTVTSNIGYAGSYTLTGSSLDNMRARDYNPATGQFTSVDPLLAETGVPYAYAADSPVALLDPTGLSWWDSPILTGAGAVVLTVINGFQLGMDPVTDGLEGADLAALTDEIASEGADDEGGELAAPDEGGPLVSPPSGSGEVGCPLGRGSTGRTTPENLNEQLAMQEVMSNPGAGKILQNINMNDSRWPAQDGWVKMQQNVNGVVIHYVYNTITGEVDDFKFK